MIKNLAHRLRFLPLPFLLASEAFAQEVEMADTMRAEGKIYVVIVVAFIVLAILAGFIVRTDRKVRKLEMEISAKKGKA